jgi:hypothetical protein
MIKAFTVSILSLFFSSVQIAFINQNTEGYLEKAGLLTLTRDICIKKGTVPGNTGRMGTLLEILGGTCKPDASPGYSVGLCCAMDVSFVHYLVD